MANGVMASIASNVCNESNVAVNIIVQSSIVNEKSSNVVMCLQCVIQYCQCNVCQLMNVYSMCI